MSNTTASQRVPPELWRIILRWSCVIVGSLIAVPDPLVWSTVKDVEEDYNATLDTKMAAMLVCRQWRDIAVEILYERIEIRSSKQLKPLAETLESSRRNGLSGGYGWWTKRLGFTSSVIIDAVSEDYAEHEKNVRNILDHCPNISVYFDRGLTMERSTSPTLTSRLAGPNLQRIHWGATPGPNLLSLAALIKASPRLRCLYMRFTRPSSSMTNIDAIEHLSLPSLTALNIRLSRGWQMPAIATWDMPLLNHVNFLKTPRNHDFSALYAFLGHRGPQLESVAFTPAFKTRARLDIDVILGLCPKIRDLQISLSDAFMTMTAGHHTLERIGIMHCWYELGEKVDAGFTESAEEMLSVSLASLDRHLSSLVKLPMPRLKCVRLLSFTLPIALPWLPTHRLAWWKDWIDMWAAKGIRFEDGHGYLIENMPVEFNTPPPLELISDPLESSDSDMSL